MRVIGWFCGGLERILATIAIVALAAMSLSLILQVGMRYFLDRPTVWSEEFATLCFVWLVMTCIPVALRRSEHIALEFLLNRLPATLRRYVDGGVTLIVLATFAIIGYLCYLLLPAAGRQQLTGISLATGIDVTLTAMYVAVPIGCVCAVLFCLEYLITGRWQQDLPEVAADEPGHVEGAV